MISEMLKVRDGRIRRILARSSILVRNGLRSKRPGFPRLCPLQRLKRPAARPGRPQRWRTLAEIIGQVAARITRRLFGIERFAVHQFRAHRVPVSLNSRSPTYMAFAAIFQPLERLRWIRFGSFMRTVTFCAAFRSANNGLVQTETQLVCMQPRR